MNAIVLTEAQATQLLAAREPNAVRVLEPRRLQDGRLILNADVLDDPYFADPSQPWAAILTGQQTTVEDEGAVAAKQPTGEVALPTEPTAIASFEPLRSGIVTLTGADLAEPA